MARKIKQAGLAALVVLVSLAGLSAPVQAAGVVGNGNPASCTFLALQNAVSGGGTVTFNCGSVPHTIQLSTYIPIADNTVIDGGGRIILSGGDATPHFQVFFDRELVLRDIILSRGSGSFGSLQNFGTLRLFNVTLTGNHASNTGGAVDNAGTLQIENSLLQGNTALKGGGAVYNSAGTAILNGTTINSNQAGINSTDMDGGGILSTAGSSLTMTGGSLSQNKATGFSKGGGLASFGSLALTQVSVSGNRAANGAGIYTSGPTVMTGVTIFENLASYAGPSSGGGLYNASADFSASQLAINQNSSGGYGGGFYNEGTANINDFSMQGNTSVSGGAVVNAGILTLQMGSIDSNTALASPGFANGISNPGLETAVLSNVTISRNKSDGDGKFSGSAIAVSRGQVWVFHASIVANSGAAALYNGSNGVVRFNNSLISGQAQNCEGVVISDGNNLSTDGSCSFNQPGDKNNTNPALGALELSGAKRSYLPLPGSPVIDAAQCRPDIKTDQRGTARPQGYGCDIGAVEYFEEVDQDGPLHAAYLPLVRR